LGKPLACRASLSRRIQRPEAGRGPPAAAFADLHPAGGTTLATSGRGAPGRAWF